MQLNCVTKPICVMTSEINEDFDHDIECLQKKLKSTDTDFTRKFLQARRNLQIVVKSTAFCLLNLEMFQVLLLTLDKSDLGNHFNSRLGPA